MNWTVLRRAILALMLVLGWSGLAAAAAFYVDRTLGDLRAEAKVRPVEPRPVQLVFTFQANGVANARAQTELKAQIKTYVESSGLFTAITDTPADNGAILAININNIADTSAASRRGFRAGLTFGLAGGSITDQYVATLEYRPATGADAIVRTVEHKLITTVGRTDPPANADRVRRPADAVATVMRQLVTHGVNRVALDPAFPGVERPAGAVPEPAPAPAPATPEPAGAEPPAAAAPQVIRR